MGLLTVEITWLKKSGKTLVFQEETSATEIKKSISSLLCISSDDFYLLHNGRLFSAASSATGDFSAVQAVPKLLGGKGGFGSMLRAIGAQIEKTTNREACRDLSGRRLRDINEEKRLKTWISQQADRERQEAERKQRKIEKLRAQPKHEFSDKQYEEERTQLIDKVHDAVEHGFQSMLPSTSSEVSTSSGPSTLSEPGTSSTSSVKPLKKKKPKKKGFMFEDEELSLSESDLETDILDLEPKISSEPLSKKRSLDADDISPCKKKKSLEDRVEISESKEQVIL